MGFLENKNKTKKLKIIKNFILRFLYAFNAICLIFSVLLLDSEGPVGDMALVVTCVTIFILAIGVIANMEKFNNLS